jgi:hypothetical protein
LQGRNIRRNGSPFIDKGRLRAFSQGSLLKELVNYIKGKAIPLQPLTGPEGSSRLRLPDFKTIGT